MSRRESFKDLFSRGVACFPASTIEARMSNLSDSGLEIKSSPVSEFVKYASIDEFIQSLDVCPSAHFPSLTCFVATRKERQEAAS